MGLLFCNTAAIEVEFRTASHPTPKSTKSTTRTSLDHLLHCDSLAAMAVHYVLDHYYLAITLLVTVGYQLLGFSIAFTLKFDKLTGK